MSLKLILQSRKFMQKRRVVRTWVPIHISEEAYGMVGRVSYSTSEMLQTFTYGAEMI